MDDLGIGEEAPREQLARQNIEGDLRFLASLREAGELLGASSRVKKSLARRGDDPRLSDLRRYANAIGLRLTHVCTPQVSEYRRRNGE